MTALRLLSAFQSALQRDKRADIVENGRALISLRAHLAAQWLPLAFVMARNGEVTLAREAFGLYLASFPGDAGALYRKVDLLAQIGAWDEVLELLRAWPDDRPRPESYSYVRGTAAAYLGEKDEAREHLVEAIRRYPHVGAPWLALNLLTDFARENDLAELVTANKSVMDRAAPAARAAYYYSLGKVRADRGEHAAAFGAYAYGAALMKTLQPYDRAKDRANAEESLEGYDAAGIAEIAARQTEKTDRAIFVVGLPRSGSTLVEQVLTSHSEVVDGGEIYRLPLLAKDVGGASYAALSDYVERAGVADAAQLWKHLLDERFPAPGRVVAKTLSNTRLLGMAASLLPEAPMIWLRRDPLDCAWSCFRTLFAGDHAWSYDLEDIAHHFRLEDELLARWTDILGERLLVVPYESLASEPEPWIRRILTHCSLLEEPGVFAPHENARTVTTSSALQVRSPIGRMGIGVATPYRDFLRPFVSAYGG